MPKKEKKSLLDFNIQLGRVSINDKQVFFNNLAVMLRSGMAISEALEILRGEARPKMKRIIGSISRSVMAGNALNTAFNHHPRVFSSFVVNSLRAGELSGALEESLGEISRNLKEEKELREKITSAMVYPMIVLSLSIVLGLTMAFVVLPKITPMFKGLDIDLPLTTQILIWLADKVETNGPLVLGSVVGLPIFIGWLLRRKFIRPLTHYLWLHLPIIRSVSRGKNLALVSRNLGGLLKSGLNIDEAVRIVGESVDNYYFKKALTDASHRLGQGNALSEILGSRPAIFPRMFVSMIKIGEQSGKLEEELTSLAQNYENEVEQATKRLTVAIEPMLLIVIGLVVGMLAMAIITPIYKITGNIYR